MRDRPSIDVALAVLNALQDGGVDDVVLAPGSRSAPLAVVLHEADARGLLRLHVRVDERSAGFTALGLAKGGSRPVAVVTTSGTAVAELHPAVLEAVHTCVPLIVLSCDRPARLRGTGANQTTDQTDIFGARVPRVDVVPGDVSSAAAAVREAAARVGPSQVNLQLVEPLLPEALPVGVERRDHPERRPRWSKQTGEELALDKATVVVAGDDAGPPVRLMAQQAGWPLLAEPTAGARTGSHAMRTYRLLLETALADDIERVVVAGHPTLSRPVTRLISRDDIEVVAVRDRGGTATDPGRVARRVDRVPTVAAASDTAWFERWREADRRLSARLDALVAEHPDALPLQVASCVAEAVLPGGLLVVGSSQPVRDLDLMATPYPPGERRFLLGNRGLAGIDGVVSTAVGAALGRRSSRALAYVGDLTFCHDSGGLMLGPDEPRPDLTIVVVNDDGGSIFSTLEQGGQAYASAFERVFGTPHGTDIGALCAAHGVRHDRVDDAATLAGVLDEPQRGIRVVEVPLDRTTRRGLDADVRALVR